MPAVDDSLAADARREGANRPGAFGFLVNGLKSVRGYGLRRTLALFAYELYYEARFRSGTGRAVPAEALDVAGSAKAHASAYLPSPYYFTHRAFKRLGVAPDGRTFVDFGCGLGRVLFFASQFPFAEIVGVEISPSLTAAARRNLAAYYARRRKTAPPWRIECADAAGLAIPEGADIFYFGDPFDAQILEPVARAIAAAGDARRAEIRVIYVHPMHADVFRAHGFQVEAADVNREGRGFMVLARPPRGA